MATTTTASSSRIPSGLPQVDLTKGVHTPPQPELAAPLNSFQKSMRSRLGLVIYLMISFGLGFFPLLSLTLIYYGLMWTGVAHWHLRRFIDNRVANWMAVITTVYEHLFSVRIRTFGLDGRFQKRSLIVMNHCSYFDWMYFWSVSDRQGDLSYWKVITRKFPIRSLPVLGQCVQFACYIFLDRKWELDRNEFRRKLYYFNAIKYPVQLLLFPEGGDFTPRTKAKSDKFADDNGLPRLQYCFYPRTTGFVYTINAMRDAGLDAVYDMTIAYPDLLPKDPIDVGNGVMPREVHYHITKYNNEDVPEDKEELGQWLRDRWAEKEERLKKFYARRHYQEEDGTEPPEVKRPRKIVFLIRSLLTLCILNVIVLLPLWYCPYLYSCYMLANVVFLAIMHKRGLGHAVMDFKDKEIEDAARKSSRNRNL